MKFVDPDGRQTISVLPVSFVEIPLDKIGIGGGFLVANPQIIPLVLSGLFILCLTGDSTSSKNNNYYETDDHQSEEAGQLLKKSTACATPSPLPSDPDDQWHTVTVLFNDPEKKELIYMEYHGVGEKERV